MKTMFINLFVLVVLLSACGCKSLARYDVRIKMDPDMINASGRYPPVEVHFVVLDANASDYMAQRSMSDYWIPGRRRDSYEDQKVKFLFGQNQRFEQVFWNRDPRWKIWKKYEDPKLWVLADLPGVHKDQSYDLRRLCVPLKRTRWRFFYVNRIRIGFSRECGLERKVHRKYSSNEYQSNMNVSRPADPSVSGMPSTPQVSSTPQVPSMPQAAPSMPQIPSPPLLP